MNKKICIYCDTEFSVPDSRINTAKFCSRTCSDSAPRTSNKTYCSECGSMFALKKSQVERNKAWGNFCSKECNSSFRKRATLGEGNPNFRGRNYDHDGYKKFVPHGKGSLKLHHYVAFENLGINKLPRGGHIHHKDCDILNNSPRNLQLISLSDHRWIHKEFGSATLWAFEKGKIAIEDIVSWSSDRIKANYILMNDVVTQGEILKSMGISDENKALSMLTAKPRPDVRIIEVTDLSGADTLEGE